MVKSCDIYCLLVIWALDPKRGRLVVSKRGLQLTEKPVGQGKSSEGVAAEILREAAGLSTDWIPIRRVSLTEDELTLRIDYSAQIPFDHELPGGSFWYSLSDFSGTQLEILTEILRNT